MNPTEWNPIVWFVVEAVALLVVIYWKGYLGSFGGRPFGAPSSSAHFRAGITALRAEAEQKHSEALAKKLGEVLDSAFPDPFAGGGGPPIPPRL